MSSSSSSTCFHLVFLILFLLISLSHASSSSSIEKHSDDSFPGSDMVDCGPRLLMLAPCAPFVQGSLASPVPACCENLLEIYDQQPNCLCTLLNDTTFVSFPINQTLALELPLLCNLSMNISSCPGLISFPGSASSPQVPHSTNPNSSSTAASPTVAVAPMFNMGLGFTRNTGAELEIGELLLGFIALWLLKFFSLI